jgi:cobalt-zinc-cadmium efflux system outer membrane protein
MPVLPDRRAASGLALPIVLGVLTLGSAPAVAQAPDAGRQSAGALLEFPNFGPIPGSPEPALGPGPGAMQPGTLAPEAGLIGGRRRAGRIPRPRTGQAAPAAAPAGPSMSLPPALPTGEAPAPPASGADTSLVLDEGPEDGLTLDAAIRQMLAANLDVLALKYEIPQADADILTAGLRTNPLIYLDDQFIPYGAFTNVRPGGPTQYDVNITYPIDLTHKRQARVKVARSAKSVLEAQFQDVIRRQIGNVGRAFVDLQSARIGYLAAMASVRDQERVIAATRRRYPKEEKEAEEASERLSIAMDRARGGLNESRDTLADAQEALALLLGLDPDRTSQVQPRGSLREAGPPPPPLEELLRVALQCRPDVVAARRGINRADAEIALQRANRLDDVFFFYDPLTYQDNSPQRLKSGRSWIIAMTFPLPIYNRNQGNIAKAHSNLHQTHVELSALERRVVSEVRLAEREYRSSKDALERIEKTTLPHARKVLERNARDFEAGKVTPDDYLGHLSDAADAASSFRDALIRHRRSMIDLNTAVGLRVLP